MLHLPAGFNDLTPEKAEVFYFVRNRLWDIFRCYGYSPVHPSSAELIDTFLTGGAKEELTFNYIDFYEGRTACFRYDFTPQIARMLAADPEGLGPMPLRLCYDGPVLRNPEGMAGSPREIYHAGVELIGLPGVEAEAELMLLAARSFRTLGCRLPKFFLNDMNIVRAAVFDVIGDAPLLPEPKAALMVRDISSARKIAGRLDIGRKRRDFIGELSLLCGDISLADEVQKKFGIKEIAPYLERLKNLHHLVAEVTGENLQLDLGELRGFNYHTGTVFDIYTDSKQGKAVEVITGGRYDNLVEKYGGRPVPAVGFAVHLHQLCSCVEADRPRRILAASDGRARSRKNVMKTAETLRDSGYSVQLAAGSHSGKSLLSAAQEMGFDYAVVFVDNKAAVFEVKSGRSRSAEAGAFTAAKVGEIFKESQK